MGSSCASGETPHPRQCQNKHHLSGRRATPVNGPSSRLSCDSTPRTCQTKPHQHDPSLQSPNDLSIIENYHV
ncbi:hypothetical protein Bca4012_045547 [Brassica carinata]